jgi:5-methylcytosine-specific restriction endonuclease McrA
MPYQYPFKDTDEATKAIVWLRGRKIPNHDPNVWRRDICGTVMKYSDHGNTDLKNGWEIDHIKPLAIGGADTTNNLQPLQWENTRKKGDTYPWDCR